jgi:hypothetical protein
MAIYEGIKQKLRQMKKDFKDFSLKSFKLSDSLVESKACEIRNLLARAYGSCDNFNPRMAEKGELKNCAQILIFFFEMQKT